MSDAGRPGDETDQRWFRLARVSLAALVAAGVAMLLAIEYMERGSNLAQVELEGLLMIGILPAWMLWAGVATGRYVDRPRLERGLPVVGVLVWIVLHLMWPASFGHYLDVVEPLSAAWAGWWFLFWLVVAGLGTWLVWRAPQWLAKRLP